MPSFQYDTFQKDAIAHIEQGHSVIVAAPTGAGKTAIAEYVIQKCLDQGEKVIYTAPIKALSNQKFRDFCEQKPDQVGIMTGDVTINPQAPVLIMTTEIFRNKLLDEQSDLKDYRWIIFDEIHYLDDFERGTVWEESLIFMPDHMNILGLSATIPNVEELKQWIESIHNKTISIVREDRRPVPLEFFFQCQGKVYTDLEQMRKQEYRMAKLRHPVNHKLPRSEALRPNKLTTLIKSLEEHDQLPCIYFVFSRQKAETLAQDIAVFNFLDLQESAQISEVYQKLCERFDVVGEPSAEKLRPLIAKGIAYHHAGMLPTLKEVVERLFTQKLIRVIFTTETFALGINMPARSVIFDELSKYYGKGFDILRTRDFYQMAGRAGRRSIDTQGYVFCRVNPHYIAPQELRRVVFGQSEKVYSQFNASYATILNLYRQYGEKLYDVYPRSFHYFQAGKQNRKRALEAMRAKVDILKEMGYIHQTKLTDKGVFASYIYGYELILSELFASGELDRLSMQELAVLVLGVIYEARKGQRKPVLSRSAKRMQSLTDEVLKSVHKLERFVGIHEKTKRCAFHLSPVMEGWINGMDFNQLLQDTDADEGGIVRYFRMTLQILRQIAEYPVSEGLHRNLFSLITLINRDVIDSEKQLRS